MAKSPDSRWLDKLIARIAPEIFDGEYNVDRHKARLRDAILAAYDADLREAKLAVIKLLGYGVTHHCNSITRNLASGKVRWVDAMTGTVKERRNQGNRAVRERTDDGSLYIQHSFWKVMDRPQFALLVQQMELEAETKVALLYAFRRVATALREYPQATTPGEACRLAGINPDDIDILLRA